jgi:hypothetical protein
VGALRRALLAFLGVRESARERHTLLICDLGDELPPAWRDAPAFPLIDGAPCYGDASSGECRYERGCIAERLYQLLVLHNLAINRTRCDMSSPFEIANESDAPDGAVRNPCAMSRKRDPENISSGERLAATRQFLYPTLTQWQFAEQWGINRTTYNNWEIGKAPVPKDFIDRFRKSHPKFGYGWFWHAEVPDDASFRAFLAEKGLISFKA